MYIHAIFTHSFILILLLHSLVLIGSQASVYLLVLQQICLVCCLPLLVHIQAYLVTCSFSIVIIAIYHLDVSSVSCIPVLCVVILTTTIILLSVYYHNFIICGVWKTQATEEIWKNLGELDASYVAVMLYQFMPKYLCS